VSFGTKKNMKREKRKEGEVQKKEGYRENIKGKMERNRLKKCKS
jgi:hypothetical protein